VGFKVQQSYVIVREFVITRRIIIIIIITITGNTHRHRCCSKLSRNGEKRLWRRTKEKKRLSTGKLYNSDDLFPFIVSILTTDRLTVYRSTHFHTFSLRICLIIIQRVEKKLESPRNTYELQFPSSHTYYIQVFLPTYTILLLRFIFKDFFFS